MQLTQDGDTESDSSFLSDRAGKTITIATPGELRYFFLIHMKA